MRRLLSTVSLFRAIPLALFVLPVSARPAWPMAMQEENDKEAADEEEAVAPEDESKATYFAILGGDVHTGTGAVLRGATLLARDGKIVEIGYDVFVPEAAETLDAHGLSVYPGLIALGATGRVSAGLQADSGPGADEDALEPEAEILWDGLLPVPLRASETHVGEPGTDHTGDLQADEGEGEEKKSDIEDTFDPFNPFLVLALATGITSVQQSNAAVKLKRYEIDGVLLSEKNLASVSWDTRNPTGIQSTRDKFAKAAEYLRQLRAWQARNNKGEKEPSKRGVDTTAYRVLSGSALALFRASQREDLLGIARFAQQFGFRPVVEGCEEGWTVADELGRAGAYAIVTPRNRLPKQENLVRAGGSSIENAAILHASGVQVAVRASSTTIDVIGSAGRDLIALPVEGGFAVRGGLSGEAALAAMTIVPARVLGIDHRVGSLEKGKDCDAIVTDGDILHYQTFVQYAVVDGKLVYDKEQEVYFAHIRPRAKPAETPESAADAEGEVDEPEPQPADDAEEEEEEASDEQSEDPGESDESR